MIKDKNTEKLEFPNNFCVMGKHRYSVGAILDACDYCDHAKYHNKWPTDKKERERLDLLQATLTYIEDYIERHGYAPSSLEIMRDCFYSSTSTVRRYLRELAERGLIELGAGGARMISVVGWEWRKIIAPRRPAALPRPIHLDSCLCDDCIQYWSQEKEARI